MGTLQSQWFWAFTVAHWPVILAILVTIVIPSIITPLTRYPKAKGVVYVLKVFLDILSFLQHKDSPGTWQAPLLQRSSPPAPEEPKLAPKP